MYIQWKLDLVNHRIVNFRKIVHFLCEPFPKLPSKALEIVNFCNLVNLLPIPKKLTKSSYHCN